MAISFFQNRKLVVATMHKKEEVIAPLLQDYLQVEIVVDPKINTDILGTFSGEVERLLDPIATARKKCELAMQQTGCDLAVASEGSFGPHPEIYFLPCNEEVLVLYDKKNDLEIISSVRSTDTNYSGSLVHTLKELTDFSQKAGFPSHALILKDSETNFKDIKKGIDDMELLSAEGERFLKLYGQLYVETDMRAMYNPTRMKVIQKAADKLIEKINSVCPQCHTPGFSIESVKHGLPCSLCNTPTRSVKSALYLCKKCSYSQLKEFPLGKEFEDPMYCDNCNP
jgi:hypothetical protein